MTSEAPGKISDLLNADLKHFGESLSRNDEIGERRFNFFLTLATSVVGGLAALYAAKEAHFDGDVLSYVTRCALGGLFVFGLMTYLRLLQKNRVTDEHHATLRYIRKKLAGLDPAAGAYEVPQQPPRTVRWLKGGLAEMTGLMTAGLFGLLVYSFVGRVPPRPLHVIFAIGAGSVLAAVLFYFAIRRSGSPAQYFRASAGAVIINHEKKVLALQRADGSGGWQMPQGGLDMAEEPLQAIYREVFEETRIPETGLKLLGRHPDLLTYELPAEMRSAKTGRGQAQRWFLFELQTPDSTIELKAGAEFTKWRWVSAPELLDAAVDFRRPVYEKLLQYFGPHLS